MNTLIHFTDRLNALIRIIVVILFIICLSAILFQVLCRSVLRIPMAWTEELTRYMIIYIVYFAASLAARDNKLTRLEVLVSAMDLNDKGKRFFDQISGVFSVLFWVIATWCVYRTIGITKHQVSAALKIPIFIPYSGIFIGSILLAINTFVALLIPAKKTMLNDQIEVGID